MTENPGCSSEFPIGSSTYTGPLVELETIARTWLDVVFKINLRDIRLMNRLAQHVPAALNFLRKSLRRP
jgi:hypothetical protein